MSKKDYYDILGVNKKTTPEEILVGIKALDNALTIADNEIKS